MNDAVRTMKVGRVVAVVAAAVAAVVALHPVAAVFANGGPFVVKYPNGDPAAKGILARLDPDLKPAREERLRVVKEDLKITFTDDGLGGDERGGLAVPLVHVSAEYEIENPTESAINVDFGFPILRGIYLSPLSMMPRPDVQVRINKDKHVRADIISNSIIYGIIRQRARELIEKAVADDAKLAELVATVRATGMVRQRVRKTVGEAVGTDAALTRAVAKDPLLAGISAPAPETGDLDHQTARAALAEHLGGPMKWNDRDVALLVEFAGLDFGTMRAHPRDRSWFHLGFGSESMNANLGALAAIGEQKATQFFAKLSACFDPDAGAAYESIFSAWGGDVRERSVDLKTGEVRPREIHIDTKNLPKKETAPFAPALGSDPTIYARVDYLDPNAGITEAEKASCKTILKNLPVVFTFAPMNLVHYRVEFPARTTQTVTVSYKQYAYRDTREPASCQLAYVVYPASLWKDFGPINLEVAVPQGVPFRASVKCQNEGTEQRELPSEWPRHAGPPGAPKRTFAIHRATLTEKTGELFLAVDADAWKKMRDGSEPVSQAAEAAGR